jgi:hypothetical protein
MSAVYFSQDPDGRGTAFWQATDDGPGVYCCGVDLGAYRNDPRVNALFADLVAVVADHFRRTHVAGTVDPDAWVSELPCAKCDSPLAADVLHRARQAANLIELGLSPGGTCPAGCCKTRIVGVMGRGSDMPRSAVR